MRRIKRLARLGGIAESEIPQMLERAKEAPADVYEIPPSALSANRVYSTRYKTAGAQRNGFVILVSIALAPSVAAFATHRGHLNGWPLAVCHLSGFALAIAAAVTLQNFLSCAGARQLEARLRAKFSKEDGPEIQRDSVLVSVSPGASPRIFDQSWAWDMGILMFDGERLVYRGEETRFALRRDEIKAAYLGQGPVSWLKSETLYVEARSADGPAEVFGVRTWRGSSLTDNARLTRDLLDQLERWRNGQTVSLQSISGRPANAGGAQELGSAKFGAVTSMSPKALAKPAVLIRMLYIDCLAGAAMAALFGFRIGIFESEPTAANSNGWIFLYVILAMWVTHIVVLLPFWRYREPQELSSAAPPAAVPAQSS
jgi:hypothetical protein